MAASPNSLTWVLREIDPGDVRRLARFHGVPEVVAAMLVGRGQKEPAQAGEFLQASLMSLHDPFLLEGMRAAAERLARAVARGETILIHGDYDVDGVAGTSLLVRFLQLLGANVRWHIPNRFTDGYSFGSHSLAAVERERAQVVVSVDNGTSAHQTIAHLCEMGVDVIVTDHHEPPHGPLPPALAIINPKLRGSSYPFRELCGAGVAFKLAWGVAQQMSGSPRVVPALRSFLLDASAFVAIATVCDVVPLVNENRILARRGLLALEQARHAGLFALLEVCGLQGQPLCAEDVSFKIGPRINAAGRLGSADRAVQLLLATDLEVARGLARELEQLNATRRAIESELCQAAICAADQLDGHSVIVVAGEGWHQGVIGIVAARLVDRYARPGIVIGLEGAFGRGSARSVSGFSILECLRGGADHLRRFGGHDQAAGFEIEATKVGPLREALCAKAQEMLGGRSYPEPRLCIDCDLPLSQMTPELLKQIDRLEPFGTLNEKPVLLSSDARLAELPRRVGTDESHLLLHVRSGDQVLKALAFGQAHREPELRMGVPLHLVYTPRWNVFRGEASLELVLHDFRADPANPAIHALHR